MVQSLVKLGTKVAARKLLPEVAERVAKKVVPEAAERVVRKSGDELVTNAFKLVPDLDGITHTNTKKGLVHAVNADIPGSEKIPDHIQNKNFPEIENLSAAGNEAVELEAKGNQLYEIANPNQVYDSITVSPELRSPKLAEANTPKLIDLYENSLKNIEETYSKYPGLTEKTDLKDSLDLTVDIGKSGKHTDFYSKKTSKANKPLRIKEEQTFGDEEGITFKQLHHEVMKALFAPYLRAARRLGTRMDVINLGFIADELGFGLGDQFTAISQLDKIPHNAAHQFLIAIGKQIDELHGPARALSGEKIDIRGISNIDDLTIDFKRALQEVAVPMREEMNLFQDAWKSSTQAGKRIQLMTLRAKRQQARNAYKASPTEANKKAKLAIDKKYSKLKKELVGAMEEKVEAVRQHQRNIRQLELGDERIGSDPTEYTTFGE